MVRPGIAAANRRRSGAGGEQGGGGDPWTPLEITAGAMSGAGAGSAADQGGGVWRCVKTSGNGWNSSFVSATTAGEFRLRIDQVALVDDSVFGVNSTPGASAFFDAITGYAPAGNGIYPYINGAYDGLGTTSDPSGRRWLVRDPADRVKLYAGPSLTGATLVRDFGIISGEAGFDCSLYLNGATIDVLFEVP